LWERNCTSKRIPEEAFRKTKKASCIRIREIDQEVFILLSRAIAFARFNPSRSYSGSRARA
jgi:hypothetical protein